MQLNNGTLIRKGKVPVKVAGQWSMFKGEPKQLAPAAPINFNSKKQVTVMTILNRNLFWQFCAGSCFLELYVVVYQLHDYLCVGRCSENCDGSV